MMTLKQSVTFIERGDEYDGPAFTIFGKDGNVNMEFRTEEKDTYHSTVYKLTPADARTLSAVLIDIAATEEEDTKKNEVSLYTGSVNPLSVDTDIKANANV
jgi:hypothetical protein